MCTQCAHQFTAFACVLLTSVCASLGLLLLVCRSRLPLGTRQTSTSPPAHTPSRSLGPQSVYYFRSTLSVYSTESRTIALQPISPIIVCRCNLVEPAWLRRPLRRERPIIPPALTLPALACNRARLCEIRSLPSRRSTLASTHTERGLH